MSTNKTYDYTIVREAMDGKSYKTTITNILPIEIIGEFIITEPIIQE